MWFPLARLVEAEIVSPYHGILINMGMGSPTVLLAIPWEYASFKAREEAFDILCLYKGVQTRPSPPTPISSSTSPTLGSNAQDSISSIVTRPSSYVRIHLPR